MKVYQEGRLDIKSIPFLLDYDAHHHIVENLISYTLSKSSKLTISRKELCENLRRKGILRYLKSMYDSPFMKQSLYGPSTGDPPLLTLYSLLLQDFCVWFDQGEVAPWYSIHLLKSMDIKDVRKLISKCLECEIIDRFQADIIDINVTYSCYI
jgi:hypothetical protein